MNLSLTPAPLLLAACVLVGSKRPDRRHAGWRS